MIVLSFLGSTVILKVSSSSFEVIADSINEESCLEVPIDYRIYEIFGVEACTCLGNTYSDDEPPILEVRSPPNNSLILVDTIIMIECSDNFPNMEGGPSFVPEYIYYRWNDASINEIAYNANIDEEPAEEEPVKVELTLPTDEAGVTHTLYLSAVDYEGNWVSLTFFFSTPGEGEESSVTWTTTTTTTTTEHRRSDGFLLLPTFLILIGFANLITWRRRKK